MKAFFRTLLTFGFAITKRVFAELGVLSLYAYANRTPASGSDLATPAIFPFPDYDELDHLDQKYQRAFQTIGA